MNKNTDNGDIVAAKFTFRVVVSKIQITMMLGQLFDGDYTLGRRSSNAYTTLDMNFTFTLGMRWFRFEMNFSGLFARNLI